MLLYEVATRTPVWESTGPDVIRQEVLSGGRPVLPRAGCQSLMYRELYTACVAESSAARPSAVEVLATLRTMLSEERAKEDRRTSSIVGARAWEWTMSASGGAAVDGLVELRPRSGLEESLVDLYGRVSRYVDGEACTMLRGGRLASVVMRCRREMERRDQQFVMTCRALHHKYERDPRTFVRHGIARHCPCAVVHHGRRARRRSSGVAR